MKLPPEIRALLVDLIDWTPYEVGDEGKRKMDVVYAKIAIHVIDEAWERVEDPELTVQFDRGVCFDVILAEMKKELTDGD